jgi:hypothetical protein
MEQSEAVSDRAFALARQKMLKTGLDETWVKIIEAKRIGRTVPSASQDHVRKANAVKWEQFAPADDMRRREALSEAIRQYPTEDRLMKPTRLGNTLRAHEQRILPVVSNDLEGYVQRVLHEIPSAVRIEHDQFRSRLDLYCTLVLVFAVIAVVGAVLVVSVGPMAIAITVVAATLLSWLSYRAAITSARGYGVILETIARLTPAATSATSTTRQGFPPQAPAP